MKSLIRIESAAILVGLTLLRCAGEEPTDDKGGAGLGGAGSTGNPGGGQDASFPRGGASGSSGAPGTAGKSGSGGNGGSGSGGDAGTSGSGGTAGTAGSGGGGRSGSSGASGASGAAGMSPSDGGIEASRGDTGGTDDATCTPDRAGTFVNLAVTPGAPLDRTQSGAPVPGMSAPPGWNWYTIDGAMCRDGSPTGFYVRYGSVNRLLLYLEGGGACTSLGFCDHNPANLSQVFAAGGETVLGSTFLLPGLQQPGTAGIFDMTNAANPFKDWNQIYVPYCTGDVHFGNKRDAMVTGVTALQQFVGYPNMQKFVARIVPTFAGIERVVLAGASAGGFGAGLDFGLVQDSFASVPVAILDDSGPPLSTKYLPSCLQKIWRDTWGMDASLPADCTECREADGSGLMNIVDYWRRKYPLARVALVESVHDEVIRLFFSAGNDNCANNDPILLFLGTLTLTYDANKFQEGLIDLRTRYACSNQFASYYVSTLFNDTPHQQIFRDRFYQPIANGSTVTVAQWVSDFLADRMTHVGP
ncbi:MAG TPA: pectin acetylesterase-family hydrolase [Polyangiaceae bacterium]|nr:pectin acetylesterase-family hydrolase [Polyangiaceae bacterium]